VDVNPPVALTIAGSDSGGGAGIQADLKTFAALGVFGTSAISALTAQNTTGVRAVHAVAAEFLLAQVDAVLDDLPVAATKTGMLATAANVSAVADLAAAGRLPNLVVDPVMVASSGDRLLDAEAERLYVDRLFPHARVVTPNLREAGVLVGRELRTVRDQVDAALELVKGGAELAVVKGGHAVDDAAEQAVDVVATPDGDVHELRAQRIDTRHNHGSGCTFASAVAAHLAHGLDPLDAVVQAKDYVRAAIAGGAHWTLGAGHGPLDHFLWEETR
jgi:hydroxymethylpyrimidine/phosphomethylpyrimidine kinase